MDFINREEEIKYLNYYFKSEPNALLFVYGPKSCGKSVLLEKTAKELDKNKYAVNFLNLREVVIYNFKTFLNVFFPKNLRNKAKDILNGFTVNAGFFSVKFDEESVLEENAFKIVVDKLESAKNRGIKPVIIIDEIQLLKSIYINGERYLIDELFNLFISITKTKNLAHVVLATSDSYFIEDIYNSAKLCKTSRFFLLEHFEKEFVYKWLKKEKFEDNEIETVWELIGGCPWEIKEITERKKQNFNVKDICLSLIDDEYGKIDNFIYSFSEEKEAVFFEVVERIIKNGFCNIREIKNSSVLLELLKEMIAHDFWFYIANKREITANSGSIYQAFCKIAGKGR